MTAPVIPTGLRPIVRDYSFEGPGGVLATPVAGGLARVGMLYDRGVQAFKVTIVCKPPEFSAWTTFFHFSIKKGSLPFQMHLDSGYGTELHTVTMIPGTYVASRASNGVATAVSFGVWAESKAYDMTSAEAADLLAVFEVYGAGSDVFLERLAQFANVDTLVLQ